MKPTRRTQPYKRGLATRLPGAARDAMRRGRAQGLANPMDVKRLAAKLERAGRRKRKR